MGTTCKCPHCNKSFDLDGPLFDRLRAAMPTESPDTCQLTYQGWRLWFTGWRQDITTIDFTAYWAAFPPPPITRDSVALAIVVGSDNVQEVRQSQSVSSFRDQYVCYVGDHDDEVLAQAQQLYTLAQDRILQAVMQRVHDAEAAALEKQVLNSVA